MGTMELLEELDITADAGAFNRTEEVALVIKGAKKRVRIKTEGWEAVLDEYRASHPKPMPPFKEEVVRQGDARSRLLGHKRGIAVVKVYDTGDADYQKAMEEWGNGSNLWVAAHCLDIKLMDNGKPIKDIGRRAELLKGMGLTNQMAQGVWLIVSSLSGLADKEDVEDFDGPSEPLAS